MSKPLPKLLDLIEWTRRELDRYARTRRAGRALSRPLLNLACCPDFVLGQIDELDSLVDLWREVAFRRGPGHRTTTRYLAIGFGCVSESIHALLAADKSRFEPELLQSLKETPPETLAALPAAAERIAAEGLAFLDSQSQSPTRISWLRCRWLETLGHLEAFVDDPRVGEARGRLLRELEKRAAKPGPPRAGTFHLLETVAELMPEFAPDPSTITFLQRIVDHPSSSTQLERALELQVRFGLEHEYGAESILESWHSTLRDSCPH